MSFHDEQALQPQLARATNTLKTALETACGADIDDADTGELIKIEEVLAIANEAAKEAVSVRRRLHSEPRTHAGRREIEDARGIRWLVFAVYPSSASSRGTLAERFRSGWLSFDCGMETRRLAPIPDGWDARTDAELAALCDTAEVAPRRARPSSAPNSSEHGGEGGTAASPG